jgi:hypothetical protein
MGLFDGNSIKTVYDLSALKPNVYFERYTILKTQMAEKLIH